jgi:hypothetical protein
MNVFLYSTKIKVRIVSEDYIFIIFSLCHNDYIDIQNLFAIDPIGSV